MKDEIEAAILKLFPDAEIEYVDDLHADWKVGDKEYHLASWYLSANEGNQDWGVAGATAEEALECAAEEDWSDHGFMLNVARPAEPINEDLDKVLKEILGGQERLDES